MTSVAFTPLELSLVFCCYNESDSLESALNPWLSFLREKSILSEILIVNDGSTDGTGRLLDRLRKEHRELRVIHQLHTGTDRALRRALEVSRGRFLAPLGSLRALDVAQFERLWQYRHTHRLVLGRRVHRLTPLLHRLLSWMLHRALHRFFHIKLSDATTPYRLAQRFPTVTLLKQLPAELPSLGLALSVLLTKDYAGEVIELPVPVPTALEKREGSFALCAKALRFSRLLLRLRTGQKGYFQTAAAPQQI